MLVVALNGPPRSGKDTAALCIHRLVKSARLFKFASPVKRGVHAAFNLMVPENYFEDVKDKPREEFFGATPRSCYINHSEKYMKPLYGRDIFGKLMLNQLQHHDKKHGPKVAIISDCGFQEEVDVLRTRHQVFVFQMHRHGTVWDSRGYVHAEATTQITNNGTIEDLEALFYCALKGWHII